MKIEEELRVGGAITIGAGTAPPAAPAAGTGTTTPAAGTGGGTTTPAAAAGTGGTPADAGAGAGAASAATSALSTMGQAGDKRGVMFGATINAEYHRKYEFDMSGSSMIKTKMIAVPPPAAFLEAIKEHARAGGTMATPA